MTQIKICGLSRPEDIAAVNAARPDYAGFIIDFPKSHRNVTPGKLEQLCHLLDAAIRPVGVFVDAPVDTMAGLAEEGIIGAIQLHGHESDGVIDALRQRVSCPIAKVFKVTGPVSLELAAHSPADVILLDSGQGTGKTFDWSLLENMSRTGRPYILAGGLTPDNLAEAIARLHPACVDLSSGVETDRVKDPEKIRAAVNIVRRNQ